MEHTLGYGQIIDHNYVWGLQVNKNENSKISFLFKEKIELVYFMVTCFCLILKKRQNFSQLGVGGTCL